MIHFRSGRTVIVRMTDEQAAALIMARPDWLAGLTVRGGIDDLIQSHVPMQLPPWHVQDTTNASVN